MVRERTTKQGTSLSRVGATGVAIGREWGGNWKSPVDKPHFQLPDWSSSTSGIKMVYASPEEFKQTWVAAVPTEYTPSWNHDKNGCGTLIIKLHTINPVGRLSMAVNTILILRGIW
jgi:hypothetical protein